jgi:hypothetical protein
MKKTLKPRKLKLDKTTLRVLATNDLKDVVGATGTFTCSWKLDCSDVCPE